MLQPGESDGSRCPSAKDVALQSARSVRFKIGMCIKFHKFRGICAKNDEFRGIYIKYNEFRGICIKYNKFRGMCIKNNKI